MLKKRLLLSLGDSDCRVSSSIHKGTYLISTTSQVNLLHPFILWSFDHSPWRLLSWWLNSSKTVEQGLLISLSLQPLGALPPPWAWLVLIPSFLHPLVAPLPSVIRNPWKSLQMTVSPQLVLADIDYREPGSRTSSLAPGQSPCPRNWVNKLWVGSFLSASWSSVKDARVAAS